MPAPGIVTTAEYPRHRGDKRAPSATSGRGPLTTRSSATPMTASSARSTRDNRRPAWHVCPWSCPYSIRPSPTHSAAESARQRDLLRTIRRPLSSTAGLCIGERLGGRRVRLPRQIISPNRPVREHAAYVGGVRRIPVADAVAARTSARPSSPVAAHPWEAARRSAPMAPKVLRGQMLRTYQLGLFSI